MERSQQLVTVSQDKIQEDAHVEEVSQDKIQEDAHVEEVLRACGYPPWSSSKVRRQMEFKREKRKKKNKKQETSVKRPMIVVPHVEKIFGSHSKNYEET